MRTNHLNLFCKIFVINKYSCNPHRVDSSVMFRDMRKEELRTTFRHEGEVEIKESILGKSKEKYADRESHVRIYDVVILEKLGSAGLRVFWYLVKVLPSGVDEVVLNPSRIIDSSGISSRSVVYKGIGQLLDTGIVAKGFLQDQYWVNPNVLFKGSRAAWYKKMKDIDLA